MTNDQNHNIDALLPPEMAERAESVGVAKAGMDTLRMFALAVLAGAFIALGAIFSTTVGAGAQGLPFGLARLLIGVVFSLGLILVIVGGAELFTGNNLIVMAWASRKVSTVSLVRNWAVVYAGNFVGALATAFLNFAAGQYRLGGGVVGVTALTVADGKCALGFFQAFSLGILCNALVCLAVWLSYSARTTADRVVAIVPPVACFVAAGFEHSVANMYYIPAALIIHAWAPRSFWDTAGTSTDKYPNLTLSAMVQNLSAVTLGNLVGGVALVGGVYWFVYLRRRKSV